MTVEPGKNYRLKFWLKTEESKKRGKSGRGNFGLKGKPSDRRFKTVSDRHQRLAGNLDGFYRARNGGSGFRPHGTRLLRRQLPDIRLVLV